MSDPGKISARGHILVVEDSSVFREMQALLLGQAGYAVSGFEHPQAALAAAAKQHFDLVAIDYELPEMNGEQFMHALRKIQPDIAVIFVSGSLTLELAIKLSSQGVAGIFNKPANPKLLLEKINETLARHAARDTAARTGSNSPLSRDVTSAPFSSGNPATDTAGERLAYVPRFVSGASVAFREFTYRLWKVRDFRAALLLQGEAGSPFELLAREMAELSIFRDGPFMVCHRANFDALGLIEALAPSLLSHDAGTLLVTGIEDFTPTQLKVLENLMTGRDVFLPFARRFRIVVAATPALTDRVDAGTFDETLYYKISSLTLTVPTLRAMRGDIVTNAHRILATHREAGNANTPLVLARDTAEWIESQDWPGNYDELAATVLGAVIFASGKELTLEAFSASWPSREKAALNAAAIRTASAAAEQQSGETRPPFPIASGLTAAAATTAGAANATISGSTKTPSTPSSSNRSAAPAGVLTAQSLFRSASSSYNFTKRLAESLATAEAGAAL